MNWWKEERGQRIFVDFNQMARDRLMTSAYSIRPTPRGLVSAPLDWEELPDVQPSDFTLLTMPERFAAAGRPVGRTWTTSSPGSAGDRPGVVRARRGQRGGRDALPAGVPEDARRAAAGAAQQEERRQLGLRLEP